MAKMDRVLIVTSEWPSNEFPTSGIFIAQQVEFLKKAGIQIDVFEFRGKKQVASYIKAWISLHKKLWIGSYSLIHAHFGQSGLICLPTRLPLIVTFHGSDLHGRLSISNRLTFAGRLLQFISRQVAFLCDYRILVSEGLNNYLPNNLSFEVIPCGIDLDLFRPVNKIEARKRLGLPLERQIILFAGNPENPVKRFYLAQKAYNFVKQEINDISMITVFREPHYLIPLYLNAADVLLQTSVAEGSPTIIKEALACDLPIVSTDVGDVRQRIKDIDGCIVCSNDSPETIALALEEVLGRNKRIKGRDTVQHLDESQLAQKIIGIYEKAIS